MQKWSNFIGGREAGPVGGEWLDVFEPATGQVYAQIPQSSSADVELAVEAAQKAAPAWMAASPDVRSRILMRIADLIELRLDMLAALESQDNGKPVWLAREVDIPRAAANFRFFASAATQFASESHHLPGVTGYTVRQPIGLVACISPWNLPLYLFTWKIAPALAAGNVVIGKPSEVTPATAAALGAICSEAGLPPGVLNIVHGLGAEVGAAIIAHPLVKAISFTGGTQTGAAIAAAAAPKFKKLSLELGGKNPVIIFEDADYPRMLDTTLRAAFSNQGQICLCGSRILIHKPIYEKFKADFVTRVNKLKVGDPALPDSRIGAVVSDQHFHKILNHLDIARQEGATVLCGGHPLHIDGRCESGWFLAPTVLEGLSNTCRTNQEEIFGPVVTLQPFEDEAEALTLANDVPYGLAATIWTSNVSRAHRVADRVEAGIVWVNCWMVRDLRTPFGGVKASGVGREGGWEAMRFFTETKSVTIAWGEE
jgi:aminomuconate-semialdehyde/2-hydroxymuconate-6-semialdehyde dehydrogenase